MNLLCCSHWWILLMMMSLTGKQMNAYIKLPSTANRKKTAGLHIPQAPVSFTHINHCSPQAVMEWVFNSHLYTLKVTPPLWGRAGSESDTPRLLRDYGRLHLCCIFTNKTTMCAGVWHILVCINMSLLVQVTSVTTCTWHWSEEILRGEGKAFRRTSRWPYMCFTPTEKSSR